MDVVKCSVTIERSPEVVFDYLVDIANHPEFTDHFLKDWHLTREDTVGVGAGARFRVKSVERFSWAEYTVITADPGKMIVARGRGGRFNRVRSVYAWTLKPENKGRTTKVEFEVQRDAVAFADRMRDTLGGRAADRRHWKRAMRRLGAILEHGTERGSRATLSGGARKPATGAPLR
jgi:uncharacterized protein YndB with AHSA1/START domain